METKSDYRCQSCGKIYRDVLPGQTLYCCSLPTFRRTNEVKPKDKQVGGAHYKTFKIQPIEYIRENNLGWYEGNVVKYVSRHKDKNGLEDINKAIHYLELIKEEYTAKETT